MAKLMLGLETITPLFLAGAEPEAGGELRPASFRGAMRYWLRALAGATSLGHNLGGLRIAEAQIFGDADQTGASAMIVTLNFPEDFRWQPFQPRSTSDTPRRQSSGHDYLYWSMKHSGEQGTENYKPDRRAGEPNQRFRLTLRTRPGAKEADGAFLKASAALWLLVHLGGIGSRSRRTGGSLQAIEESGNPGLPPFTIRATTGQGLAAELRAGLAGLLQAVGKDTQPTTTFNILHPAACQIWVVSGVQPWNGWLEAVQQIGGRLRDYRSQVPIGSVESLVCLFRKSLESAALLRCICE